MRINENLYRLNGSDYVLGIIFFNITEICKTL